MREGRHKRAAKKGRDLRLWGHKRSQSAPVLQNLAGKTLTEGKKEGVKERSKEGKKGTKVGRNEYLRGW